MVQAVGPELFGYDNCDGDGGDDDDEEEDDEN